MRKICFYLTTRGNYAKTKSIIDNLRGKVELQFILGDKFDFPYQGERVTISDDAVRKDRSIFAYRNYRYRQPCQCAYIVDDSSSIYQFLFLSFCRSGFLQIFLDKIKRSMV